MSEPWTANNLKLLRQQTVGGGLWMMVGSVASQILLFVASIVLARFLPPRDFGLVGMILALAIFARLFVGMGLGTAIIQRSKLSIESRETAFSLQLVLGILTAGGFILAAPLISRFYGEPQLTALVRLLAIDPLLMGLVVVPLSLLRRELRFREISLCQIGATVLANSIAVWAAWRGWGPKSLILGLLVEQACKALCCWYLVRPRLVPRLTATEIPGLLGFGGRLTVASLLHTSTRQVDNILIGRWFGGLELGLYNRAYSLMLLPVTQVSYVLMQVLFPGLSQLKDDLKLLREGLLRALGIIAFITFPMMAGIGVTAEHLVIGVYGEKWRGSIILVQFLCGIGALQSIGGLAETTFHALGEAQTWLRITATCTFLVCGGFILGIIAGTPARFAAIYVAVSIVVHAIYAILICRRINLQLRKIAGALAGVLGCTLCMATAVWALDRWIGNRLPHTLLLFCEAAFGVIVYAVLVHLLRPAPYMDLKQILVGQWRMWRTRRYDS